MRIVDLHCCHNYRTEHNRQEAEARQLFAVDPLKHSCRPCGGIWSDLKKLRKRYVSDFLDAFHFQVLITIIFLYITLIAPAIAFGGLMEEITLDQIGETETLVATGLCGIVYGLFSVQPLTILAFTGPVLLFEEIVLEVSRVDVLWMYISCSQPVHSTYLCNFHMNIPYMLLAYYIHILCILLTHHSVYYPHTLCILHVYIHTRLHTTRILHETQFAELNHIEYLEWRACISLWLMVILIIFAVSESTRLVTYFTRFSEEVFTGVVVIFFIFEVSKTIYGVLSFSKTHVIHVHTYIVYMYMYGKAPG